MRLAPAAVIPALLTPYDADGAGVEGAAPSR